jgi:hypothetical protein
MYGQQSLTPPADVVTSGFGGGQLMAVLVPACAEAADAAALTLPVARAGGRL